MCIRDRSGGGKVTQKHVEELSMGVLFLLEAAQKTDKVFQLSPQSMTHTIRSSVNDINKIVTNLIDTPVTKEIAGRLSPVFVDPSVSGWKKLTTTSWLKDTLERTLIPDEHNNDLQADIDEADLYYELCDVV